MLSVKLFSIFYLLSINFTAIDLPNDTAGVSGSHFQFLLEAHRCDGISSRPESFPLRIVLRVQPDGLLCKAAHIVLIFYGVKIEKG